MLYMNIRKVGTTGVLPELIFGSKITNEIDGGDIILVKGRNWHDVNGLKIYRKGGK